jgi:hypothetical protein
MDANGILGSICFPTFPGFAGARFQTTSRQDPEVALAAIRAYNDWHVHDWAGAAPGRFIPLMLTPFWDMQAAVAEVDEDLSDALQGHGRDSTAGGRSGMRGRMGNFGCGR